MKFHLAQVNIATAKYGYEDPKFAGFVDNLDRIYELSENTPGFVWRYVSVDEDAEAKAAFTRALELNFNQPTSSLELAELAYEDGQFKMAVELYESYRRAAQQNSKSLCLGMKLGAAVGNADQVASYGLALKRLFPDQADRCRVKS